MNKPHIDGTLHYRSILSSDCDDFLCLSSSLLLCSLSPSECLLEHARCASNRIVQALLLTSYSVEICFYSFSAFLVKV